MCDGDHGDKLGGHTVQSQCNDLKLESEEYGETVSGKTTKL